ncbi:hypothetical protein, partial [Escherichia coli]|uniref:hypothetical protein n=1 Tax=Escherichia coli TaxID=562 RepID=UPI001AD8F2C8
EEYVKTVQEIRQWQEQMHDNVKTMKAVVSALGSEAEILTDMYENWTKHQATLVRLCNNLLQTHLTAQRMPPE